MNISIDQKDAFTLAAHISLDGAELEKYISDAREELAKGVTLEGFRPGKVPKNIAEKALDPAAIRSQAMELALEGSFTEAVTKSNWDISRTSDLKVEKNDATGLDYTVVVHLWPTVKLCDLATVKVAAKEVVVTDADIDESLDTLRNLRASYLDKTGPAAEGDRVEVDFDASLDGLPLEGGSSRNHPLVIGGKTFMPGFEEQLVGLTPGMTKEFTIVAPADYYEQKLAGKPVAFKVTVHKVQAVLKPAADDAFAASVGTFPTLAALRDSLRVGIQHEKDGKEQQRARLAILDGIIATSDIPVPTELVDRELEDMVHRFSHDLEHRGMQLSMYLARLNKTEEQMRAEWKPEAERQVKMLLVIRQVAREQKITVDPAELESAFTETVTGLIKSGQVTEETVDPDRVRSMLAERLLREAVFRFLEQTCIA